MTSPGGQAASCVSSRLSFRALLLELGKNLGGAFVEEVAATGAADVVGLTHVTDLYGPQAAGDDAPGFLAARLGPEGDAFAGAADLELFDELRSPVGLDPLGVDEAV